MIAVEHIRPGDVIVRVPLRYVLSRFSGHVANDDASSASSLLRSMEPFLDKNAFLALLLLAKLNAGAVLSRNHNGTAAASADAAHDTAFRERPSAGDAAFGAEDAANDAAAVVPAAHGEEALEPTPLPVDVWPIGDDGPQGES